ncbi:recombinase family protein [Levilactobacillus zymae]|uniref:recombinase family protein n=1 Tax=Levilactobacillus zymae TaxID=267363 RepID=UPI003FCC6179
MKFGYARVSSKDQNLTRQMNSLTKAGCEQIYSEKASGKNLNRPQLQELLNTIHMKDEVIVEDLDRLGRNNRELTQTMRAIQDKGATFDGIADPNLRALLNNLVIEIYKYQAEAERQKIRERQREGIDLAKQRGVYQGRPKKYSKHSHDRSGRFLYQQVLEMLDQGIGPSAIARKVGVSRSTIYRIKGARKEGTVNAE